MIELTKRSTMEEQMFPLPLEDVAHTEGSPDYVMKTWFVEVANPSHLTTPVSATAPPQ